MATSSVSAAGMQAIKAGFLTCEAGASKAACYYLVLARSVSSRGAWLFRFDDPAQTTPLEPLDVTAASVRVSGMDIEVRSEDTCWRLRCVSEDECLAWAEMLAAETETEQDALERLLDVGPIKGVRAAAEEFALLFGRHATPMRLVNHVGGGELGSSALRSMCWRRLLGLLPEEPAEWEAVCRRQRLQYDEQVRRHSICAQDVERLRAKLQIARAERGVAEAEEKAVHDASLRLAARKKAESLVVKDLERTHTALPATAGLSESVDVVMLRMLVVWALERPKVGYRQGMSEILHIVLLVLAQERETLRKLAGNPGPGAAPERKGLEAACRLFSERGTLEHDAFALMDKIFDRMLPLFNEGTGRAAHRGAASALCPQDLPQRLEHIQHHLLQRTDPELAACLHAHCVEPHMYLVRWMRLLFIREVPMPELLLLWDAILAYSPRDFALVDALCVALLTESQLRAKLVACEDAVEAIRAIKSLPPLRADDARSVVARATRVLRDQERYVETVARQLERGGAKLAVAVGAVPRPDPRAAPLVPQGGDVDDEEGWFRVDDLGSDFWDNDDVAAAAAKVSTRQAPPSGRKHPESFAARVKRRYGQLLRLGPAS